MENRITLHGHNFKPLIPNAEIEEAIDILVEKINHDFEGVTEEDAPILLCTLNGAMIFMGELLKRIKFPCIVKAAKIYLRGIDLFTFDHLDEVDAASYGIAAPLNRSVAFGVAVSL